jgi:uncharacterized protein YecE (DUF72 family)
VSESRLALHPGRGTVSDITAGGGVVHPVIVLSKMKGVRVGCSGWSYQSWRGVVYDPKLPQDRWLERYAELFDTVEVNNTFYRLPSRDAVSRWVERTPPSFVFAVKASRYLTHVKRLADLGPGVERFHERIEPLVDAGKLGPLLWQLPPRFGRDDERLASALERLPPGRHAFEFRDESWFAKDVYALLRAHDVALAVADHPDRPWSARELTTSWTFVRLHHGRRGRRGNYSKSELETWKRRLAAWRSRAEVYVYFNNDWKAFAPRNARYLQEGLSG